MASSKLTSSRRTLTVEVRGAGFQNKGAELMLHAVLQEVAEWEADVRVVVSPSSGPYEKRARLGLHQKLHAERLYPLIHRLPLAPKRILDRYGLVVERDVDLVLDCSGFAYSDQWGPAAAEDLAAKAARWRSHGKRTVLLPQALGPFEKADVRTAFCEAAQYVDLVYARDETSRRYAEVACENVGSLRQAPDFTCLVRGRPAPEQYAERAAVVPNVRMLDKTDRDTRESYPDLIGRILTWLADHGHRPYVLVHDSNNDLDFARSVVQQADRAIEVVCEEDPLAIKGLLGSAHVVVASRYHALVSALTQSVPVLGTSWSHKYEALLADFSMGRYLVSPSGSEDPASLLAELTDAERRLSIIDGIEAGRRVYRQQSEAMWASVRDLALGVAS